MTALGSPKGVFSLANSDSCVGSFISVSDAALILGISDPSTISKVLNCADFVDELALQKAWYAGKLPDALPVRLNGAQTSLYEHLLCYLLKLVYPEAAIEQQVKWGRKRVDIRVSVDGTTKYIEFLGPNHFAPSRYNASPGDPTQRKQEIEDTFGEECILWPYWIHRCERSIRAIFDEKSQGFGAIWSSNVHFSTFSFPNASAIIQTISDRFRSSRNGYGYFYESGIEGSNKPEHPILSKIRKGSAQVATLLPQGYTDRAMWLPEEFW